jgi:hypothetical protein
MRFGRTAGLSKDEIKHLGRLDKEDFDEHLWIALVWARTYILFEGTFPDKSIADTFQRTYPPRERKAIFATLKLMLFFNMLMNVFDRRGSRLLKR